ncbi:MAG: glycosyltransferase, partial [Methanobacterium paludis]|nr:glycosyltransferase [Methanobacterium paludis]
VFWSDEIVADSKEIKRYFDSCYSTNVQFIPYGAKSISEKISWDSEKLPERIKGVTPNPSYWLVVARLEPENNIHTILEAYVKSNVEKPLLVVGNFSSPKYKATVMDIVNQKPEKQVIFAGGIYNPESLNMLRQNCFAYIHGHSVGGTNPSLLEIMTMKTVILAHENPFNREVCGDSVVYFDDSDDLREKMETVDANIEDFIELKEKSYQKVKAEYCWDTVIDKYNSMFDELLPKNYDEVMDKNHVNAK